MIIRALDPNRFLPDGVTPNPHYLDWSFGKGKNNYVSANLAVGQSISTRLASFLGDCFFDLGAGLDWFTFLGSKDQLALELAVSAIILNTQNVTGILELSTNLDKNRKISLTYKVATSFGVVSRKITRISVGTSITTEDGISITTESGDKIVTE